MITPPKRQRGAAIVLIAAGMIAMLAAAALALDIGHVVLNKSRLQATVDAAALTAAKVLYDTQGGTGAATAAATATIASNATAWQELGAALGGGLNVAVTYSSTLSPFAPGSNPPNFVRVVATDFPIVASFAKALGIASLTTAARAVAGPIPVGTGGGEVCDLAPILVCGTPGAPGLGYTPGQLVALKLAALNNPSDVGPGNFHLVRLGGSGGNVVRENMAGGYTGCAAAGQNAELETEPGDKVGPTVQGLNTRFGDYQGGDMNRSDYPPDVVTDEPTPNLNYSCPMNPMGGGGCSIQQGGTAVTQVSQVGYSYDRYAQDLPSGPYDQQPAPHPDNGHFLRRQIAVPIAQCDGAATGQSTLPVIGVGCFFLLQDVVQQGNEAHIFGEVIANCRAGGVPGPTPGPVGGSGPEKIVLYNDVGSGDS
jgi:Flp pilus assembly protein TadG